MSAERVRNLVIGSGEAGKSLAWHLAHAGEQTFVIERRLIGGSCPNTNCLPSKNEIWSAKVADLVHHASQYGVGVGASKVDLAAVRERKRRMVDGLIQIHLGKYKASGAQLVMGSARFRGPRTVEVELNAGGRRTFIAERVFLNLGTRASIPDVPGLEEAAPLTHVELLELDRLPEQLVVIGGGFVGMEFAQAYRRFGSRVTILQSGPTILDGQDDDVVEEVARFLTAAEIEIVTSAQIARVSGRSGESVVLNVRTPLGERTIGASDLLVAAGRTPNTADLGLELAGVRTDARGCIQVNEHLETSAEQVWAMGECAGSPQFTHVSFDDFRVVRDNLAGQSRSTRDRLVPSCLFTDPQVAHVGLSEREAKQRGLDVRVAKIPMAAVLRAHTLDEKQGFMKALVGAKDDRILGFTMVGTEAGEVMAVVQTAMIAGAPFTALRDAIFTHPTMAEGLNVLFTALS